MDGAQEEPECLNGPTGCSGTVEYRLALSPSGRSFPRCEGHWLKRLDTEQHSVKVHGSWRSDVPPAGFDPLAAGERWLEDE